MKERLVIVGAGGHAKVILEIFESLQTYEITGCTGQAAAGASDVLGYPVLGSDEVLPELYAGGTRHAFVAIGDNAARRAVCLMTKRLGFNLVAAVSPHAIVSRYASVEAGAAIMPGAVVNAHAMIQEGSIINTGATVDHDCIVGPYSHLGPGTHLAGFTQIGEGAFLGVGVSVIDRISIGRWSVAGAGAVVIRDVEENARVAGLPARAIR